MGKRILEKNYHRLDPVGQSEMCANCSTTCKTSCSRKLAQDTSNKVSYIIDDVCEPQITIDRLYTVTIKDVDSIPCDLKEQKLEYNVDGVLLSDKLVVPWEMDWIYAQVEDYLKKDAHLSGVKKAEFKNPEEDDQLIVCEITSYVQRK